MSKIFAVFLVAMLVLTGNAQQTAPVGLAKKAAAIKRKADSLTPQAHISVVRIHAEEEYGSFVSNDAERLYVLRCRS